MNDNGPAPARRDHLLRRYDVWIARAEAQDTPESRARMRRHIMERGRIEAWMRHPQGVLWLGAGPETLKRIAKPFA